jgi:hypothetical protein
LLGDATGFNSECEGDDRTNGGGLKIGCEGQSSRHLWQRTLAANSDTLARQPQERESARPHHTDETADEAIE